MRLNWLTAGLLAAASPAMAAEFCDQVKDLEPKVRHCEDNGIYQEAAVRCIQRFDAEIDAAGKLMGLSLLAPRSGADKGQSSSFDSAKLRYHGAKKVLNTLIAFGNFALKDLTVYEQKVVFPDDVDSPGAVGKDLDKFLLESDCYRETYEVLFTVRDDFKEKLAQLESVKQAALKNQGTSADRESGVRGQNALSPGKGGAGKGAPVAPKNGFRPSDISGTEDSRKP